MVGLIGDWLGTNRIADNYKTYRNYDDAKKFVQKLELKSQKNWNNYAKSGGQKPEDIPYKPQRTYQSDWVSWGDWLGTDRISDNKKEFCTFNEAREYARNLNLFSSSQWLEFCKSENKPNNIPTDPRKVYKNKFKTMQDFLGYKEIIKHQGKKEFWLTYDEAQKIVSSLNLTSGREYKECRKKEMINKNIPSKPDKIYKDKGWKGWVDFLGKER